MEKIKVGVVYGGRSVEHEVSIISALQVIAALDKEKYHPVPLFITKKGIWYTGEALLTLDSYRDIKTLLPRCTQIYFSPNYGEHKIFAAKSGGLWKKPFEQQIDVVLPVTHGTFGEDGCLQGLLELSGVPYVGPAVLGSAIGMDKIVMKAVLKEAGLPVTDYMWFYRYEYQKEASAIFVRIETELSYPVIVKPANLGSSIGITKVNNTAELEEAIELAISFAERVLVEQVVTPLREVNCAVLGSPEDMEFSYCEEPLSADDILSFKDKYLNSAKSMEGAKRRIPADIPEKKRKEIEKLAAKAFTAMDGNGVCRIDFLLNKDTGEVFINELNTIPGSLSFYLWEPSGKSFTALIDQLIHLALKRYRQNEKKVYYYASNILEQVGFKGKK
jgi:D-alanine-D-alanine ligase